MAYEPMSAQSRIRINRMVDGDPRPVLGPSGNKNRPCKTQNWNSKPRRKPEKPLMVESTGHPFPVKAAIETPQPRQCGSEPSIRRQHADQLSRSMSASCSSDASSDSSHSRASTGTIIRKNRGSMGRKQSLQKVEKRSNPNFISDDALLIRTRCAWITRNADPLYAAFHDEEWGNPIHDDKHLFELLTLSGALAEISWPTILNKRHLFKEVFLDFDPAAVSRLNERKIVSTAGSLLLSESRIRAIIENGRRITKIVEEFGSFDGYVWGFVGGRAITGGFRQARHVPVRTPKAEVISKDMVGRGFRSVGPTVVYSFMQACGMTNDHLVTCFRFHPCRCLPPADDSTLLFDPETKSLTE